MRIGIGLGLGLLASVALAPVAVVDFTLGVMPSWLTFTATGNRMQWDSTGKLTYAPNNLYINSGSATSTARTITTVAGVNYYIWIQTSSGSATIVASGTNTTTFNGSAAGTWTAFTATAGTLTLTPTSNFANITQVVVAQITYETALRSGDNVVTGASAYYGPRFDYDPSTLAAKGLLIEESRVNLALQSNTFTTTWAISNVSLTATSATSPDGTNNGWLLTNGGTAYGSLYQTITASNATAYTYSVFAKAGTQNSFTLEARGATGNVYDYAFTLSGAGTATVNGSAVGSPTGGIQQLANGWYRCWITKTTTNTTPLYIIGFGQGSTATNIYIFGAQMEAGSFATSYIPTTSASVTRAADVVTIGGAALTALKGAAGSLVAEVQSISAGGFASNRIIGFDTVSQTPLFMFDNNTVGTYNGSIGVTAVLGSSGAWSSKARGAVAWSASGRSVVANGGTLQTDGNLMSGSAWTVGYIGSNVATNSFLNGWISKIAFYNQRLPNATLQAKSVVGASFYG